MHAEVWTATVTPTPASARESSSSTRMYERKSAPAPPYSSGTHTPIRPSSPSFVSNVARKRVCAIPLSGVRLDLRGREIAGERLDLPLLRRELEVHGGQTTGVRWTAIILVALALAGCGGHKSASAEQVRGTGALP